MKLFIEKIKPGAYDSFTKHVYDYWIEDVLESGKKIEIFDQDRLILKEFEGYNVECLIYASLSEESSKIHLPNPL